MSACKTTGLQGTEGVVPMILAYRVNHRIERVKL